MITETGKVVAIDGGYAWVQTIRTSACQSCSARSGCGQRALASVTGGRANRVRVSNSAGARVGDDVVLGIDEQALLRASLWVYGVPLLALVVGCIAGFRGFGGSELSAVAGAVVGLAGGFWLVRRWQAGNAGAFEPRMLRVQRIGTVPGL
ncbi:positive regulator of sigma(E), RseC/MucC [Marinobacter persicus]|uniref:Positive regulator of sigma(E), RseC/MucC n=1 Tax=Marinobacter persicus TaxID=930118 RepID=A0A1I3UFA3_9GAMM|nr:SoxR reducing system RseC family protein [Marinobacter persicus]GHD40024.1 SoxR reducing system protein RseC [Marinobacter persicus]SFJ80457.1 positive regulator of sigma(E), RseC/MucC [Marinobacter persicus]